MIEASELRLGNLVSNNGRTLAVNSIGTQSINCLEVAKPTLQMHGLLKIFEPIPLTEELLLAFGFELNKSYGFDRYIKDIENWRFEWHLNQSDKSKVCFSIQADGGYDDSGEYDLSEKVKYAHQLQNLFFALTNTELIYNPKK